MKEKTLFRLALISSLVGIFIILFLAETISPTHLMIGNITKDHLEQTINTAGVITSSKETPGLIIINLKDSTGEIIGIIFKDENFTIKRYLPVRVTAKVIEYENELELQIEQMIDISNQTQGIPEVDNLDQTLIEKNRINLDLNPSFKTILILLGLNVVLSTIYLVIKRK